jgi:hypothetical protein
MKCAGDGENGPSHQVDRQRRKIAGRAQTERYRQHHAYEARGERHLHAFQNALDQQLPATEIRRDHAGEHVRRSR